MPLRQSTLNFGFHATALISSLLEKGSADSVPLARDSSTETDTIVVNTRTVNAQLPTPSESATDASSQSSQMEIAANTPASRPKRVPSTSTRRRKRTFEEDVGKTSDNNQDKIRSVSGDTLIAEETIIVRSHEDAVLTSKLSWTMNDEQMGESREIVPEDIEQREEEESSVITVREEPEDETMLEERRAAKRAKIQENAKKWQTRKEEAERNATRKSNRATFISKAGELLDNIKDTVLGKRSRTAADKESEAQEKGNRARNANAVGPSTKKLRTGEASPVVEEPTPKHLTTRREKKWVVSGLYAGQPRMFDARLTENKNKRKSKTSEEVSKKENTVLPLPMFAGERLLQYGRDFKLPFDVFSPLPAGQPKPDEWKKVNKNVFVGDAAAEWRTSRFVEHSTCLCHYSTGCDQDCMNRYMYYECDENNCTLAPPRCGNRAFETLKTRAKIGGKYNVGVEVIKTADRGYGVRSNRTFEPNQIIVEYTGEIITQDECERRMRTLYKDNECYYLMLFDQNMIIDATRGSIARFVNHSCEPNCRMEKWTVGGKPRMALFAGDRGIMTGEELTYDYNFDPYSQKNVQQCRCGSKNCRGVLGPKPKPEAKRNSPEDEAGKKKEGKVKSAKRKIEEATNRPSKKVKKSAAAPKKSKILAKVKVGSPKRKILVKKVVAAKKVVAKKTSNSGNSKSKLKKMVTSAKGKASTLNPRRAISTSSASEALVNKKKGAERPRSLSLKNKARQMAKSVRARGETITVAG